jgi:hypothetical protein
VHEKFAARLGGSAELAVNYPGEAEDEMSVV